jgi:hypothetical protein
MSYIKPQISPPFPLIFAILNGGSPPTLGVRFGLAHFSNGLWFFDDFSKLT